jgi:transcriptional regulator with XRE-family HTH domain
MAKGSKDQKRHVLLNFAAKIRNRRHELGMTQEQLAEKANFHVNYIGGIERSTRNPSLTSIIVLAKALGLSPKDLMPNH